MGQSVGKDLLQSPCLCTAKQSGYDADGFVGVRSVLATLLRRAIKESSEKDRSCQPLRLVRRAECINGANERLSCFSRPRATGPEVEVLQNAQDSRGEPPN